MRGAISITHRRYCHILDPRSGMPVVHWQSVSVVAPLCVVAGSCATITMLFAERALAFLAEQQYDYLAVDAAGKLHRPDTHFPTVRHPS